MGLLDDAIREHLELKRRRGADADEVARLEDEALGDPRSGEFVKPDEERPAEEQLPPESPAPAADEPAPQPEDAPWLDAERIDPPAGQPTAAFTPPDVEPDVARRDDEPAAAEEDVLEETPDFDRLWFEQKPPRDFDFDN